jgi:hypothetical protein
MADLAEGFTIQTKEFKVEKISIVNASDYDNRICCPDFNLKSGFIDPYLQQDRGIDSTRYGFRSNLGLKKSEVRNIKKSIPSNGGMCKVAYKSGFAMLPALNLISAQTDGNQDKMILVGKAAYIILLKNNEIDGYARKMNQLIDAKKEDYKQLLSVCEKRVQSIERMEALKAFLDIFLKVLPVLAVLAVIGWCSSL